ncbi:hypothetical protein CC1G_11848 [Coprinopsis cinerea okayama7|uniref:Uncharacterized protein n=1 Tax=Coprinopsis cinerea (strain Okayama-7 / 130 / ATCC MYA-4618 / FGSC 9003) TaxID=240176 RepID=A8PH15_COPC7|nr:hypothetical protein CC1G_11848 [Coprinopsis cinerea okayama7\|eukprot:XP_001841320.1 hypothetical protein CC1G_11848 [Coprinopsis cinerea okayama7\
MKATFLSTLVTFALAVSVQGAINDPCTAKGQPGICITTSDCSAGGGTSHVGFCPRDPAHVRCCTKKCNRDVGTCRFTNTCTVPGSYVLTGLCPGPASFRCCMPPPSWLRRAEELD